MSFSKSTTDRDALLNRCFEESERRVPELIRRCIEALLGSLQAAEGACQQSRQRQLFAQATISLAQNRSVLVQTFPRRLTATFADQYEDSGTTRLARLSDSSMLQLVDDAAVNESLESVRLLQHLLPLVEHSLPILDARMSTVFGLASVEIEKNPLRPSVFARELRDLMADVEPDAEVRALWMQHIAHVLGRELGQFYEQLATLLQKANVQEASYRIRLVEDPEASRAATAKAAGQKDFLRSGPGGLDDQGGYGGRGGSGGRGGPALPGMRELGQSNGDLGSSVFQSFLNESNADFDQPLDDAFYEQVRRETESVDALAAMPRQLQDFSDTDRAAYQSQPVVDRAPRRLSVDTALADSSWGEFSRPHERTRVLLELKERAQHASQAIGLDLVRKLVNQVARDPLLLAPVREAVVALEPALLRLALAAPRYFGEADHPARRLVEEVAQQSFRFNDEFAADFRAYMAPVGEAFKALNALRSETPEPFAKALQQLRARWEQEEQAEQRANEQQLAALRHAEARQELADQIAWEISLRPDVYNAPALALDFLYESWSLVIASSELDGPEAAQETQRYRAVVGTLLWSVRVETLRQPKQVFERLPALLKDLHAGLDRLGKTGEETQSFFDVLMRLHSPLLRLRRVRAQQDSRSSDWAPLEGDLDAEPVERVLTVGKKPVVTSQPWMAAREWVHAGFDDTLPAMHAPDSELDSELDSQMDSTLAPEPQPALADGASTPDGPVAATPSHNVQGILASLGQGTLVDLYSQGEWFRAELVWTSARGALFMFTSSGGRAHSMTRRSCEKLIRSRWLRLVETRAVVDVALKTVMQQAVPKQPQRRQKQGWPSSASAELA